MPKVLNKRKATPEELRDAVYVGRPSKWGNPHPIGAGRTREEVLRLYEQWIMHRHNEIKADLRGKDLVCWCAPKPCHADILLRIANGD